MACYSGLVDRNAQHNAPSRSNHLAEVSFHELALQQGVTPVKQLEELLGTPSPDDESVEEFAARLREWRREGTGDASPQ